MPSISKYERRDYIGRWNAEERLKSAIGWLVITVLALGIFCVILAEILSWPVWSKAEASYEDDAAICKESLQWFLSENDKVVDYCVDLMKRGL